MVAIGTLARGVALLFGLGTASVRGQYDDFDFEDMMGGYGDMYGGGYGGMSDMMGGMMGGMGGMMGGMGGGMGYGGYGYGQNEPAHTELTDMADVEKFMDADPLKPSVIAYYNEDTQSEEIMAFRTTASRMTSMGVRFGLATEDDVLEKLKYTSGRVMAYPAKRFMEEGTRAKNRYPGGSLDPEPLQMWILKVTTPLVGLFTWDNGMRYEEIGLPELTAFGQVDIEEKPESFDEVAAVLRKVASGRSKKELSYVVANFQDILSLASRFKFAEESKEPEERGVSVGIRQDNAFYRMDGEFNEENVAAFVDAYVKGSLKPIHVEDEPMSDAPDSVDDADDDEANSDVVVLTPENFEGVVKEEGKDVMLEFYAPWCGHCKQLKPVYAEVASAVSDMPSVVVAKMDADKHTPPAEFSLQSYPTLMFLKAGDKSNPINYEGPRDKDSMVAFIRENASPPAAAAA